MSVVAMSLLVVTMAACDPPPDPAGTIKVNFAPVGSSAPTGYVDDHGEAFSSSRGRGWIAQSSSAALSIVGNARDRARVSDQRFDSLIHMQYTGADGVAKPARWEQEVPNGVFDVTVAVGDSTAVDSTHRVTVEGLNAVAGFTPTTANRFEVVTVRVKVNDGRVTLDAAGGTNTKLDYVEIVPVSGTAGAGVTLARISFQDQGSPIAPGYVRDYGEAYSAAKGFGWVAQSSSAGVSLVGDGRDRDVVPDPRLDTLISMQNTNPASGPAVAGRWEYAVPNGTYDVRVRVGDAAFPSGSTHRITVEGTVAIDDFVTTDTKPFGVNRVRVNVTDGRITLSAAGGTKTKINYVDIVDANNTARRIVSVDPSNGATDVPASTSVSLSPSNAVDLDTLSSSTVYVRKPDGTKVAGNLNSDAAGGIIAFTPSVQLAANTTYTVRTTTGLRDTAGVAFAAFTSTFRTSTSSTPPSPVDFDRQTLADINGPTSIVIGPDSKLYVGTNLGQIYRYTRTANGGFTGSPQIFNPFGQYQRVITGLAFEPGSTASNLRLWVNHGKLGPSGNQPNYTGKLSLLTGANLGTVLDKITSLPRSTNDHMNNGIAFGPDGKLYLSQGALSGYGGPDQAWGFRAESKLSASILVADVTRDSRFAGTASVDVNTEAGYNPDAANAPVKVYAEGVRNAFDFVWAANGSIYLTGNESAGGNTPAGPNNDPPALNGLPAGRDYLTKIVPGKYYGHPNPSQGHYVLNGGNPTSGTDPFETPQYPIGVQPDPAYQRPLLDLGLHRSANGVDQYLSNVFGSTMYGKVIFAEFSSGDDIVAVNITNVTDRFQIASGFYNPLDVRVDQTTGNIYVAEYGDDPSGAGGHITILRPNPK